MNGLGKFIVGLSAITLLGGGVAYKASRYKEDRQIQHTEFMQKVNKQIDANINRTKNFVLGSGVIDTVSFKNIDSTIIANTPNNKMIQFKKWLNIASLTEEMKTKSAYKKYTGQIQFEKFKKAALDTSIKITKLK